MQQDQGVPNATIRPFGNERLYVSLLLVSFVLLAGGLLISATEEDEGIGIVLIGVACSCIAQVYFLVVVYRAWKFTINEARRHNLWPSIHSPWDAIVLLLIPVYNLYWAFRVFGKLPKDLNMIAEAKGSSTRMPQVTGTALAVIWALTVTPILGYIAAGMFFIVAPLFMSQSISMGKRLSCSENSDTNYALLGHGSQPAACSADATLVAQGEPSIS